MAGSRKNAVWGRTFEWRGLVYRHLVWVKHAAGLIIDLAGWLKGALVTNKMAMADARSRAGDATHGDSDAPRRVGWGKTQIHPT